MTESLEEILAKHSVSPSKQALPELALLYSPHGCGKTYLAATASEIGGGKRTLILDTEGSTVGTLRGFNDDLVDIVRCDVNQVTGHGRTSEESFQFLNTILTNFFNPDIENSYEVLIIDTFDVAQGWAVEYFQKHTSTTKSGEKDGFSVWQQVKDWSLWVARQMKVSPAFGVLVVHEREEKNQDGGILTKLNVVGAAKDILPGIPDMVGYLTRVKGETTGFFESAQDPQSKRVTKNRFGIPEAVLNPTFPKLFEFMEREDRK